MLKIKILVKPPAFITCANDDDYKEIPLSSVQIYQDWIKADAKVEFHMFSVGGHGFGMNELNSPVDRWSQLNDYWILFLKGISYSLSIGIYIV